MGFQKVAPFLALLQVSLANEYYTTVTPCPSCDASCAPEPITVTEQYQTVSTCTPASYTTAPPYSMRQVQPYVEVKPDCSSYVWVSTTVPVYANHTKTYTVVTETTQTVTVDSQYYTKAYTTEVPCSTATDAYGKPLSTVTTLYSTIDVKKYCPYNSIGHMAISGYEGSGLCTDCGSDGTYTQAVTVVSCNDYKCTTFPETWVSSPKTYQSEGQAYTATETNTYCETATPITAMPGYGPAKTAAPTYPAHGASYGGSHGGSYGGSHGGSYGGSHGGSYGSSSSCTEEKYGQPTHGAGYGYPGHGSGYPGHGAGYPGHGAGYPGHGAGYPGHGAGYGPAPTYGGYQPNPSDGPSPSDASDYYDPSAGATAYEPYQTNYPYKMFKRQGLEKPRGQVVKRGGLLFWDA